MKNIVLIGFAGCGKSSTGRKAAKALGLPFFDSDLEIEKEQGISITEIFETKGAAAFRTLETEMMAKLAQKPQCIIATGGGVVTIAQNMQILKQNGIVIYMQATPEKILANIGQNTSRPLLQTEDKEGAVRKLMAERLPLYAQYADVTIDTTSLTLKSCTDSLVKAIRSIISST